MRVGPWASPAAPDIGAHQLPAIGQRRPSARFSGLGRVAPGQ